MNSGLKAVDVSTAQINEPHSQTDGHRGDDSLVERRPPAAALLQGIVAHSLVGIQIIQNGRYAYANHKVAEIFGYSEQELLDLDSWTVLVADQDRERVIDQVRRRESGEIPSAHYIFKGRRKDGAVIDVEIRSDRTELDGRPAVIGMLQDVSEGRRAEQALRESEERFRNAFDLTNVAMVLTDLEHHFVRVNEAFARMFGYSCEDMLKLSLRDLTHPDDLSESYARREPLLAGKSDYFEMEKRYLHKDGRVLWALTNVSVIRDSQGHPRQYVGQVQDITERKRDALALQTSERRFRALIENSNDAVLLRNSDGVIEYASPSVERVLGHSPDELTGIAPISLIHPDEAQDYQAKFEECLANPGRVFMDEHRLRQKDGTWRWIEVTRVNLLDDTSVGAVVDNLRDVTMRKRLEEQFRQAQKMQAVGRLAGGVAHDFNNLLTIILGYSELVAEGLGSGDPLRDLVEQISSAGERASLLTRQLLAFSRKQVLQPVIVDLNLLVTEMERMLRRLIGEDVDLTVTITPELWRVKGDNGQMEQVLMNLAINARDAMANGGKLTIETSNVELDELYVSTHHEARAGEYVRLAVSDTGCGMDAAILAQVFEPFFTTKGEKGTGLGLATVYGIVKQSGGHIEVYSEVGLGTTFKVYLPRDRQESLADQSRILPKTVPHGNETILLTEDEDAVRTLTRLVLQRSGYRVLEARHGEEALRLCAACDDAIHLLVTDVVMPNMSGRQVAERLLTLRPDMKVLFVSGYTDDAIVRHGVLDAEMHFLQKPFTADGLAQKVREVLDTREKT